nr:hypothetical protein [Tanacetum cinerariifolium]
MASAIICLATNQKFNFLKYIFDHIVKNLEGGVKFLMFPRFVQVFLDSQVEGMLKPKEIYVTPSHTKKSFANMKRQGKDFSVAFLEKSTESEGFKKIINFLNANPIKYALTVNPRIYTLCIKQFWVTTKVKTVNGEEQIQALVDKKKVIITETSVRSDLHLKDAEGTECLLSAIIFEQLTLMCAKTTAWNEFSSTMASAIIYMGEDSEIPTDSHHTLIVTQPSTSSQPQKKHKSKNSKKRITEVP